MFCCFGVEGWYGWFGLFGLGSVGVEGCLFGFVIGYVGYLFGW